MTGDLDQAKAWQRHRNRQSNGFGKNFEKSVLMACEYYKEKRLADISKVDEPFRVVKLMGNGRFLGQFTKKANPDFEGTLAGGKSICFECKYTSKDRIQESVITKHQKEVLERKYVLGGKVGVVCGIQERYFFVPWEVWREFGEVYGKKSACAKDLERFEVPFRSGVMFLDGFFGRFEWLQG